MHLALTITDILHEIFQTITDEIKDHPPGSSHAVALRDTLAQAALTCHTFCSPALDALYYRLYGLMPLLRLLPTLDSIDNVYVLAGRVSSNDLTRFEIYANRVFELTYDPDSDESGVAVDPSVYFRLAQVCRRPLPHLRVLELHTLNFPSAIQIFITPTLSHVQMDFTTRSSGTVPSDIQLYAFETFLDTLVEEVPSLQHLALHSMPIHCRFGSIEELKNLKVLSISCPDGNEVNTTGLADSDMYRAFAGMKCLVELNIDLRNSGALLAAPQLELDSLERITLGGTLPLVTHTLSILSAPRLSSLDIKMVKKCDENNASPEEYTPLFDTLPHFRRLRKLEVSLCHGDPHPARPLNIRDLLAPLMSMTQLWHLDLKINNKHDGAVAMDDDDVSAMALAWPEIRSLRIWYYPLEQQQQEQQQAPTIGCLASFARHCPQLFALSLPVDARSDLPSEFPAFSHGLITLSMHSAGLAPKSPLATARFIDGMFPTLIYVEGREGWSDVHSLVGLFQYVRRNYEVRMGDESAGVAALSRRFEVRERGVLRSMP